MPGMWFTRAGFSSSTGWSRPESPSGEERKHWASEVARIPAQTLHTRESTGRLLANREMHVSFLLSEKNRLDSITRYFYLLNQKMKNPLQNNQDSPQVKDGPQRSRASGRLCGWAVRAHVCLAATLHLLVFVRTAFLPRPQAVRGSKHGGRFSRSQMLTNGLGCSQKPSPRRPG